MKAFFRRYLLFPSLFALGLSTMLMFQNCSNNEATFDSEPGSEFGGLVDGQNIDGTPAVGGNSDVVIQINEAPTDSTDDTGAVIDYEVTSPTGTITDVSCMLNMQAVNCDPTDRIDIPPTGTGPQTFTITATNNNGVTVTETITWTVYDRIVTKTKDFNVMTDGTRVDIIINVDNSGSMEYEQSQMAGKIANFIAPFAGLDYNIAVTTTSPIGNSQIWKPSLNYVDGKFIPLDGANTFCVKSAVHSQQQAQDFISANVVRSPNLLDDLGAVLNVNGQTYPEGNGYERGIFTTYRAFERDIAGGNGDATCIRDGSVPKHVILISDEDETLYEEQGANNPILTSPLPDQAKSNGTNLINYVAAQYGANTVFKFHSIIVNPFSQEGQACLAAEGRIPGQDYGNLSLDTGGYIGSVCAADYSQQLGAIGQIISNSPSSEALECVAVPDANGNLGNVVDLADDMEIGVAYAINGRNVDFGAALPAGDYRITYYCYE